MTRMTGPDCVVMCNLINTHTHTELSVYILLYSSLYLFEYCCFHLSSGTIHSSPKQEALAPVNSQRFRVEFAKSARLIL